MGEKGEGEYDQGCEVGFIAGVAQDMFDGRGDAYMNTCTRDWE